MLSRLVVRFAALRSVAPSVSTAFPVSLSRVAGVAPPLLSPLAVSIPSSASQTTRPLLALLGVAGAACLLAQSPDDIVWCMPDPAPADAGKYVVSDDIRKKYGRYPPWCRLNVDQVPLPFVNDMEETYAELGATRVTINQLGPALSKRQATGQVCFRPAVPPPSGCTSSEARRLYAAHLQEQPAPCILFRGKGNISDVERAAYPDGLVVLWQDKAWVDRPVAVDWVEDVIGPFIKAERRAGVADEATCYLLFQDNLDSQKQPEYLAALKRWAVDDHKLPPNETDQVQPIDRGLGRHIKIYMGQQVIEWHVW